MTRPDAHPQDRCAPMRERQKALRELREEFARMLGEIKETGKAPEGFAEVRRALEDAMRACEPFLAKHFFREAGC